MSSEISVIYGDGHRLKLCKNSRRCFTVGDNFVYHAGHVLRSVQN